MARANKKGQCNYSLYLGHTLFWAAVGSMLASASVNTAPVTVGHSQNVGPILVPMS